MDPTRIVKWLNDIQGWLEPPGCETEFTAQPGNDCTCCTVGIVHEHRFAFYYWALYSSERDKHRPLPALITLDSHDDVGVPGEIDVEDLDTLHLSNRTELGLFAWTRLRRLNDGQILPALYLNLFSDVYVLMNNEEDREEFLSSFEEQQLKDRYGNVHTVKYYQQVDQLMQNLPSDIPVFLDIDLDFFAVDNPAKDRLGSEILRPDDFIKSFLSIDGPFFGPLLKRIVGLTIALEPKYCGGLLNSLRVLDILNRELFDGTLCTDDCKWRTP
ncbi:hypothetical protein GURASL_23110 [Geotalea uraniireducens]|uniref:Uncharacterized protein n=1 Tax=Geotalea uraniireducens TaxID=351604 RepID=A0ABN6VSQ1_9BACT|nr:hypothetical protein [Geotalea uraniireducens]BDV43388.1 hypothetical protein GURASL_23110 [Geotalea uraniireducens]